MKRSLFVGSAVVLAAALAAATPATAATPSRVGFPPPSTVASGLSYPQSFGVDGLGNIYAAQPAPPLPRLTKITPGGTRSDVAGAAEGDEISAVSVRAGTVYYSVNVLDTDHIQDGYVRTEIRTLSPSGASGFLADLNVFEARNNPDGATTYGSVGLPDACAAQFPPEEPATYLGPRESHPYGSVAGAQGLYVADAAANAIFRVGYDGVVSTVAVLPPILVKKAPAALISDAPPCADGYDYRFQPMPRDIDIGPGGQLFVTTTARPHGVGGDIWRINPSSGALTRLATGFCGATGIAVSPKSGVIFVAEPCGGPNATGQVSVLLPGATRPSTSIALSHPVSIELRGPSLYVSVDALSGPGATKIVKVPLLPTIAW